MKRQLEQLTERLNEEMLKNKDKPSLKDKKKKKKNKKDKKD